MPRYVDGFVLPIPRVMRGTPGRTAMLMTVIFVATTVMAGGDGQNAVERDGGSPEAAVGALWSTLDGSWNERDAERFSDVFTEDASLEFVNRAPALEGRAAILRHFAEQFPTFPPDLRHQTSVLRVRPIASTALAIDGKVEILRVSAVSGENPALFRTFSIFAVMRETTQGWRIQMLRAYQLSDRGGSA